MNFLFRFDYINIDVLLMMAMFSYDGWIKRKTNGFQKLWILCRRSWWLWSGRHGWPRSDVEHRTCYDPVSEGFRGTVRHPFHRRHPRKEQTCRNLEYDHESLHSLKILFQPSPTFQLNLYFSIKFKFQLLVLSAA